MSGADHHDDEGYASEDQSLEAMSRELLYITVYEQILESLASEHGAGLEHMPGGQVDIDFVAQYLKRLESDA